MIDSVSKRSIFGGKKISEDPKELFGIDHYEQSVILNDIQKKQKMVENRIRRLAFEQERAQKLTEIATTKAEKLLEARERHQKKIEEKMRLREMRKQKEE